MRWAAACLALLATPALAVTCEDVAHLGQSYTVCEVDPATDDLQLFLRDDAGDILGSFDAIESHEGRALLFAMNAGMYHEDRAPVGYYVEDSIEQMRVIPNAGPGNFGMLPNGIFCIDDGYVRIVETGDFLNDTPQCRYATQSGPMLVLGDALHPRLIPGGTSKHYRNGVGASLTGDRAYFAISNEPVNFHDFATLFRDTLGLPNALYFDGKVSRLYAPGLGRDDYGWQMGPIVGVLAPVDGTASTD